MLNEVGADVKLLLASFGLVGVTSTNKVTKEASIKYVVQAAVSADLTDFLMITGRNKRALEDHFDRVPLTEQLLEAKGDTEKLAAIQHATELGEIHYVRQGDPKDLGHAVLRAKTHVGHGPFAVLLGDDLIEERG